MAKKYGIKEATRHEILHVYETYGISIALNVARNLLKESVSNRVREDRVADIKTGLNGELGEVVLEILVKDYVKRNPSAKDWYWTKGLILKDPKGSKDFLTELDFTLFTPECIYLFECKSYSGDKTVTGYGEITRNRGNSCDVYKQSCLHTKVLNNNVQATAIEKPVYRMVVFNFSMGDLVDKRDDRAKSILPFVNEYSWENTLIHNKVSWDMESLIPLVKKIEKSSKHLREKHLEYVKSIRR